MDSVEFIYDYHSLDADTSSIDQRRVNNLLYEFKEGVCDEEIKDEVLRKLKKVAVSNTDGRLAVCFVPASKLEMTVERYTELASFINQNLSGIAYLNTLSLSPDFDEFIDERRRITCRFPERIKGKTVVFIDMFYNTGNSYKEVVDILKSNGASNTIGLYLARVVRKPS